MTAFVTCIKSRSTDLSAVGVIVLTAYLLVDAVSKLIIVFGS